MHRKRLTQGLLAAAAVAALAIGVAPGSTAVTPGLNSGTGPKPVSIDRLAFSPYGALFIADNQGAAIYAVDLDRSTGAPGLKSVEHIEKQVGALIGSDAGKFYFTDLAVDPKTGQGYLGAVMSSGGSALFRVDGAGVVTPVALDKLTYSEVDIPNPMPLVPGYRATRDTTVTSMAYDNGRLYVAGLSNEEFSSKLRSIPYPFRSESRGAGIEIFHTSHGQMETRSPVYTLLPMRFGEKMELLAAYICTPLVRLPEDALKDGAGLRGTTIAEMGRHNRPIDMVRYTKDGQDWLLMANSRRGVLKVPVSAVQDAQEIPESTGSIDTRDLGAKRVRGNDVDALALAGADSYAVLARNPDRGMDLQVAALP